MNEKVMEHLDIILGQLTKAANKGVEFGAAELPILIKEILNYQLAESLIVIFLFPTIIYFAWTKVLLKWKFEDVDFDLEFALVSGRVIGSVLTVVGILCVICEIFNAAKIILAPRLYLLEYLKDFIK